MIIRKVKVTEYEYQAPINYVAGATEPDIQFQLTDYEIPSGATGRVYVGRSDGTFEYTVATISGNNVTVAPTSSMFSVKGPGAIQVTLYVGNEIVKNFAVPVYVHADLADDSAEAGSDVTGVFRAAEEEALADFQEQAEEIAEEVRESIPSDYTELTEEVDELNERLHDVNELYVLEKTPLYDGYDYAVTFETPLDFGQINGSSGEIVYYNTIKHTDIITVDKETDAVYCRLDLSTHKIGVCLYQNGTWVRNSSWLSASDFPDGYLKLNTLTGTFNGVRLQFGFRAERPLTADDDTEFVTTVSIRRGTNTILADFNSVNGSAIKYLSSVADISSSTNKTLAKVNANVRFNATSTYWDDTPTGAGGMFMNFQYTSGYNTQLYIESITGNRYERVVSRSDGTIYRDWTAIITTAQVTQLTTDTIEYISAIADISTASNKKLANINKNVVLIGATAYWDDTPTGAGGAFINLRYTSGYNEQIFIENGTGNRYERVVSRTGVVYRDWTLDTRTRFVKKRVYCTGDSIMWGRTDADGRATVTIPQNIASRFPVSVTNSAVGGDTISHREDGASVYDRIRSVNLSTYDYVVINGGTNDYGYGATLGTIDSTDPSTFYGSYKAILDYIFAQNPNMRVMLITPTFRNYVAQGGAWHYGNGYEMTGDGGYNLKQLTEAIENIGEMYNVPVFNSMKNSPINKNNYESTLELTSGATDRYLHPTDAAYVAYGNSISSFFGSVF